MPQEELLAHEIERAHFARAAYLAAEMGRSEEEIRSLRLKALWQMAAVYRNMPGTRKLAEQFGLSKEEVLRHLRERASEAQEGERTLEPCYDQETGKYLQFNQWLDHLDKTWNKWTL